VTQSWFDRGQSRESGGGARIDYDRAGVTRDVSGDSETSGSGPAT
jgi:hypothetical protein